MYHFHVNGCRDAYIMQTHPSVLSNQMVAHFQQLFNIPTLEGALNIVHTEHEVAFHHIRAPILLLNSRCIPADESRVPPSERAQQLHASAQGRIGLG